MTFEEFQKMDLRVARILAAERVAGSEKLIRLEVDCGDPLASLGWADLQQDTANVRATRQVVAGIGKAYEPENLVGKEIIIVANLEPRQLMGLTSNGMLLAAHDKNGEPVLLMPEKEAEAGSKIS